MKYLQRNNLLTLVVLLGIGLVGCEGFFGKKVDSSFIDVPIYQDRQVAYVPIQPVIDQELVHPVDIIIGYDELLYVVDDVLEEISSFDLSGNFVGRFSVPGVHAIAMDRSLDILALGTFDTLGALLPAVYRVSLNNNGQYGLNNAQITNRVLHPFYYKSSYTPGFDDLASFNGIDVRANNGFYIARSGPRVSGIYGPQDAMVQFDETDDFISTVRVNTNGGIFGDYFKTPFSVTTLAKPPQSPFVNTEGDFIYTSLEASQQLKVRYIDVVETDNGTDYLVKEFTTGDTSKADGFLYSPGRFGSPADVTYTGDGTNYIFVIDREKDSLYQFTNTGLEGVKPPAGSSSAKNIKVSFGGTGNSLTQFRQPSAVAYYRQIVYVADAGNGRVLRFKLTTDFD